MQAAEAYAAQNVIALDFLKTHADWFGDKPFAHQQTGKCQRNGTCSTRPIRPLLVSGFCFVVPTAFEVYIRSYQHVGLHDLAAQ